MPCLSLASCCPKKSVTYVPDRSVLASAFPTKLRPSRTAEGCSQRGSIRWAQRTHIEVLLARLHAPGTILPEICVIERPQEENSRRIRPGPLFVEFRACPRDKLRVRTGKVSPFDRALVGVVEINDGLDDRDSFNSLVPVHAEVLATGVVIWSTRRRAQVDVTGRTSLGRPAQLTTSSQPRHDGKRFCSSRYARKSATASERFWGRWSTRNAWTKSSKDTCLKTVDFLSSHRARTC